MTLESRWRDFDESYVAYCAGDGHVADLMETIEALVDIYWSEGVVDVLEERAEVLPGLAPAIESCWWSPAVPEDLIERLDRLARQDRARAARLNDRTRRRNA